MTHLSLNSTKKQFAQNMTIIIHNIDLETTLCDGEAFGYIIIFPFNVIALFEVLKSFVYLFLKIEMLFFSSKNLNILS